MEFGPLKVSTMTWTAAITGTIDLDTIFNEVVLATEEDDGGIVHVIDKEHSVPPSRIGTGKEVWMQRDDAGEGTRTTSWSTSSSSQRLCSIDGR
jgi:hypothetical protein